jgi:ankyrin repeat protein
MKTSLHLASQYGHIGIVRALLEAGAHSTAQDKNNWTPLHFASLNGQVEVTQALLESGADTTVWNKAGEAPLEVALLMKHHHLVALLSNHGCG